MKLPKDNCNMKLNKIIIDNFSCFKHFDMTFPDGISLIIGRNGAGKTSLLKAVVYAMHFMFTTDKNMGEDILSAGNPDLHMTSMDYDEFFRDSKSALPSSDANIHGDLNFINVNIKWDMYRRSTAGSAVYPSRYRDAYSQFMSQVKSKNYFPVLAYYSDSFPHKETNVSAFARDQIYSYDNTLRNFGYYQWDKENACYSIWAWRLVNDFFKKAGGGGDDDYSVRELNFVEECLKNFSKDRGQNVADSFSVTNIFFEVREDRTAYLWLHFADGNETKFDNLPAGYRRLFSIVIDLACRIFILNQGQVLDPSGIVIIDEVDLHLHPSLAAEVVSRFKTLFSHIQFIFTSHNPIVISGIKQEDGHNAIFRLVKGGTSPHRSDDLYGIDYNTIVTDVMGVDNEAEEVEFLKDSIKRLLKSGATEVADVRIQELKKLISEERFNVLMKNIYKEINL